MLQSPKCPLLLLAPTVISPHGKQTVVVESLSRVRLFVTLWTVARRTPLSMQFPRQEYWSGLPFPSPGDLPNPEIEPAFPAVQVVSCIAGRFSTNWAVCLEYFPSRSRMSVFSKFGSLSSLPDCPICTDFPSLPECHFSTQFHFLHCPDLDKNCLVFLFSHFPCKYSSRSLPDLFIAVIFSP